METKKPVENRELPQSEIVSSMTRALAEKFGAFGSLKAGLRESDGSVRDRVLNKLLDLADELDEIVQVLEPRSVCERSKKLVEEVKRDLDSFELELPELIKLSEELH